MRFLVAIGLGALGLLLITIGLWWMWPPLALIVLGVALTAFGAVFDFDRGSS